MNIENTENLNKEYEPEPQKISVIVTIYNVMPFLEEALNSAIGQTYRNLEIILIDDGSSDGSERICDRYAQLDPRVKVVHQKNQGVSAARNAGLDNATGDFITFLDADDAFYPNMIETMRNTLVNTGADIVDCKYDLYFTDNEMTRSDLKMKPKVNGLPAGMYSFEEAARAYAEQKLTVHLWNKLFRRELFDTIRYPVGQVYEDVIMFLPLLENAKTFCVIDDILVKHRKRRESITNKVSLKHIQDRYYSYKVTEDYIRAHTPDVFTAEHLKHSENRRAGLLMSVLYQNIGYPDAKHKQNVAWLKQEISRTNVNQAAFDWKKRIFNIIYGYSLPLMPVLSRMYRGFVQIVNKKDRNR